MVTNKKQLNLPVIVVGGLMLASSFSSPTLETGIKSNNTMICALRDMNTQDMYSYQKRKLRENGMNYYEESSDTLVENNYNTAHQLNEKIVYTNKVMGEMEKISRLFGGFVELTQQGQQEYKQTLDTVYESVGLNIFEMI